MSKLLVFLVFSGLSGGTYSILVMFFMAYLDGGVESIYRGHYSLYYLVGSLALSSLLVPSGFLADKVGRKRALIIGGSLSAVGGFIAPLSTEWWHLLLGSGLLSAGSALISPAQASLVADITRGYKREKSYGLVAFASVGSTTVGTLFFMVYSAFFATILQSDFYYRFMLAFSAVLGLLAVIPLFFIGTPHRVDKDRPASPSIDIGRFPIDKAGDSEQYGMTPTRKAEEPERLYEPPKSLWNSRVVQKIIAINVLIGFGAGFIIPLFTYYWRDIFRLSDESIAGITVLGDVGMALGSMVTPWVARHATKHGGRVGTIVAFQTASIAFAGYLAIVPFQMNLYLAVIAYIARTDLMNMIGPLTSALLMDHSPANRRGVVNSLVSIAFSVPNGISPSLTSLILNAVPTPYGYTYSISAMVFLYSISSVIYATTRKADRLVRSTQHL
ncbi:MAG: MFS transporter [Promethearchaeati archaeon SRVP18_Atabeyarchaeia-1]